MLYTNTALEVISRRTRYGSTMIGVTIGKRGHGGCREVFLSTPKSFQTDDVIEGFHSDLTIDASKPSRPKIDTRNDSNIYLILSSEGSSHTDRGYGLVMAPVNQEIELIARGRSASIRSWDDVIVKAKDGDVFRITWGGFGHEYDTAFYVVSGGKVHSADQSGIEALYKRLGLEILFPLDRKKDRETPTTTPLKEWQII